MSGQRSRAQQTRTLIGALTVLTVLLAAQGVWWLRHERREAPAEERSAQIMVSGERPVAMAAPSARAGVDAAAAAAQMIVGYSHKDLSAHIEETAVLLTPRFAMEYRASMAEIRDEVMAARTVVRVRVARSGVVRTNDTELQALVFLDQRTTETTGGNRGWHDTRSLALVTVLHTDGGWLVDGVQTE